MHFGTSLRMTKAYLIIETQRLFAAVSSQWHFAAEDLYTNS